MFNKRSKTISILLAFTFVFTLIIPGMTLASACVAFSNSTATVSDKDEPQNLGFVKMDEFDEVDSIYIEVALPSDVDWHSGGITSGTIANFIDTSDATVDATACITSGESDEDEYVIQYDTTNFAAGTTWDNFYIKALFRCIDVDDDAEDDIYVSVTVRGVYPDGSTCTASEDLLIGEKADDEIIVSAKPAENIEVGNEQEIAKLIFTENVKGALAEGDEFILTLPDDIEWDMDAIYANNDDSYVLSGNYSLELTISAGSDNDELVLTVDEPSSLFDDEFEFTGYVTVFPGADEGDVEVSIESVLNDADFKDVDILVAYVSDKVVTIDVDDDQDEDYYIGEMPIKLDSFTIEPSGGSFEEGDTIYLTLSSNAVWVIKSEKLSGDWEDYENTVCSVDLDSLGVFNGSRSLWLEVPDGQSYDDIEFSDMPVAILPYNMGQEITVTVGGDYTSEPAVVGPVPLIHADVSADILSVDSTAGLNQEVGTITITEKQKDAFKAIAAVDIYNFIYLQLPGGVYFSNEPSVAINGEKADVTLWKSIDFDFKDAEEDPDNPGETDPDSKPAPSYDEGFKPGESNIVYIEFDDFSSDFKNSRLETITISDIAYDFDDRYQEGGDISVSIGGALFNDWMVVSPSHGQRLIETVMYSVVNANTGYPSTFTIGSTTYYINGVEDEMDVAPFISGDRTYMPIRFAAYALGINDSDILWVGTDKSVTLIKGDKVVQLKVGSTELLINGASVTMDAAPVNLNGRVCLPIRFVAQAFGAEVGWDAATHTVSIDL